MARHDRAHGVHHAKRAKAGNRRRVPSHQKSRNKTYATGEHRRAATAAGGQR